MPRPALTLRPIAPDDAPVLAESLPRLSLATRYRRFHAAIDRLSPAQWRYLTEVDGVDHVAFVACLDEGAASAPAGTIVGVGRFIRSRREPRTAEIAFVVFDDVQRCGVGSALRDALVDAASARGITSFFAYVQADNVAMRRLLRCPRLTPARERNGVLEVHILADAQRAGAA